jgi:hypothetical protein
MSFTSRQDKELIGKRRKIDSGIEEKQRLLGKTRQVSNDYRPAVTVQPPFMSGALRNTPESISVRIGDHALSAQGSVALRETVQRREDVEQVRQSSESMLFDVEQRELSQPQGLIMVEERVEQEPRLCTDYICEQEASGSWALPLCISDDTDTSRDNASALDKDMREPGPMNEAVDAAADEGLGVEQLLDQLNGQDNDGDQRGDDQGYGPRLPVENRAPRPASFRLMFESSSVHNATLPLGSPSEPLPGDGGP